MPQIFSSGAFLCHFGAMLIKKKYQIQKDTIFLKKSILFDNQANEK
jgi:hypothetical protein